MRLYDLTTVIRSKNAGPFTLTIDLFFDTMETFETVLGSASMTPEHIAGLYKVPAKTVRIHPFREVCAIKVSLPRTISAGGPADRDVYGAQQHFPLGNIEL